MPELILIGGPNGAGKTTFARDYLPRELEGIRFLNNDEIARGLSPFNPDQVNRKAGRILLGEIDELIAAKTDFALESTLSGRSYSKVLERAKAAGYRISFHFLWIPDARTSLARVKQRVKKGGHSVPEADIFRRYDRIMANLTELYLPLADQWIIWDNRDSPPKPLASHESHTILEVFQLLK